MTLDLPRRQRLQEVVGAVAMAPDAEVVLVPPGVAGGDDHVVATGVVARDLEHRPAAVGSKAVTPGGEETPERHDGVHRAQGLREVAGAEGDEVGDLPALDVDDAQALPGSQRDAARGAGRNGDPGP